MMKDNKVIKWVRACEVGKVKCMVRVPVTLQSQERLLCFDWGLSLSHVKNDRVFLANRTGIFKPQS